MHKIPFEGYRPFLNKVAQDAWEVVQQPPLRPGWSVCKIGHLLAVRPGWSVCKIGHLLAVHPGWSVCKIGHLVRPG